MAERKTYTFSAHREDAKRLDAAAERFGVPVNDLIAIAIHRHITSVVGFNETPPGSGVRLLIDEGKSEAALRMKRQPEGKECV